MKTSQYLTDFDFQAQLKLLRGCQTTRAEAAAALGMEPKRFMNILSRLKLTDDLKLSKLSQRGPRPNLLESRYTKAVANALLLGSITMAHRKDPELDYAALQRRVNAAKRAEGISIPVRVRKSDQVLAPKPKPKPKPKRKLDFDNNPSIRRTDSPEFIEQRDPKTGYWSEVYVGAGWDDDSE